MTRPTFRRIARGVLAATIDGVTYTATYYPSGGTGTRAYWTIRESDREAAEPGYDNDWYEPNEWRVRASIVGVAALKRKGGAPDARPARRSVAFPVPAVERAHYRHQFAITVPADLHERITRKAKAEGVSVRSVMLSYLNEWSAS